MNLLFFYILIYNQVKLSIYKLIKSAIIDQPYGCLEMMYVHEYIEHIELAESLQIYFSCFSTTASNKPAET